MANQQAPAPPAPTPTPAAAPAAPQTPPAANPNAPTPSISEWIELAKITRESFHNRRKLEWKLAFGFWTAIGAVTALFLLNDFQRPEGLPLALGLFYGGIFLVALVCCLVPLQVAHAGDRAWWKYYLDQSQQEKATKPEARWNLSNLNVNNWLWLIGQTLITALFLGLSWYAIVYIVPKPKPPAPAAVAPAPAAVAPAPAAPAPAAPAPAAPAPAPTSSAPDAKPQESKGTPAREPGDEPFQLPPVGPVLWRHFFSADIAGVKFLQWLGWRPPFPD